MNTKTRKLVLIAIFIAIIWIFYLTPLGYLKIPGLNITFYSIPVVIGTLTLGLGSGLILGLMFGITSLLNALAGGSLTTFLFALSPVLTLIVLFIPRLLIPVSVHNLKRVLKFKKSYINTSICALAGSLTNTIVFLGLILILFDSGMLAEFFKTTPQAIVGIIVGIGVANGLPEALATTLLSTPIISAINKTDKKKQIYKGGLK